MIFPEYSIQEWLCKHPNLSMPETTCIECGELIKANIPYVEKGIVGFIALECPSCHQSINVPRSLKFTNLKLLKEFNSCI